MKTIYTFGEQRAERNLTVADLRAAKGVRKLTQTNPCNSEEARAAADAGIELLICGQSQYESVRAGAPHTFLTAALMLTDFPTETDTIRAAFHYMEAGADAIYTPRSPRFVKMLADEGIPVMGHLGLVPRKCTWVGGLRAVGTSAAEAVRLMEQFKELEQAGAFGVEAEVIPEDVLGEISSRTSLITFSLGSGALGDVIYLFASDILGESDFYPRHAKSYANLRKMRDEMQAERVRAFREFAGEARAGTFPTAQHSISAPPDVVQKLRQRFGQ